MMTSKPQFAGLTQRFKSIRDRATNLREWTTMADSQIFGAILTQANTDTVVRFLSLVKLYEKTRERFHQLTSEELTLDEIIVEGRPPYSSIQVEKMHGLVEEIIVNCDAALGYLRASVSPIPKEMEDNLEGQRGKIAPIQEFDQGLYRHLNKAIDEHEAGHYLAAAMLAGKSSMYLIEKWPGGTPNEAIAEELVKRGVLSEALKPSLVTGLRRARVYFTHDLSSWPDISEALNMVSSSVDFALRYWKTQQKPNPTWAVRLRT